MRAYTQGITKEQFVTETKLHQKMDHFVRGTYDDGEKGCAVGCALKSVAKIKNIKLKFNNHQNYEKHLGVPEWLARLEDTLFENVTLERSKTWPVEFAEAINEGSDLEKIKVPFIVFLMNENLASIRACVYDEKKNPDVKKAINMTEAALIQMIVAQESGDKELIAAAELAAWSAAWSAAKSAAWSAAESAAWSAAKSAAWSAESAAKSARSAAGSAAESAAWSARSAAFEKHADKLLELMRECK